MLGKFTNSLQDVENILAEKKNILAKGPPI